MLQSSCHRRRCTWLTSLAPNGELLIAGGGQVMRLALSETTGYTSEDLSPGWWPSTSTRSWT